MIEGMLPEFSDDGDGVLLCPKCQFDYLHHFRIEVTERDKEDGPVTVFEIVKTQCKTQHLDSDGERRNSFSVSFWCEGCHGVSRLEVIQNRGRTHVGLVDTGMHMPFDSVRALMP